MQTQFWELSARSSWPNLHTGKTFLAAAVIALGDAHYGSTWTGSVGVPSGAECDWLKAQVQLAASSGDLKTSYLEQLSGRFRAIPATAWRSPGALAARFAMCRIDSTDLLGNKASGSTHCDLYVDTVGLQSLAASMTPAIVASAHAAATHPHASDFLRFLIFAAEELQINFDNPPVQKQLTGNLKQLWSRWIALSPANRPVNGGQPLSERLASSMATILRGEAALFHKGRRYL